MNDMIKEVCDTAEEVAYQEALKSNEEDLARHKWISDPKGLARRVTDHQFGRVDVSKLEPINVEELFN